jgi:hypothetical protein
VKVEQLVAFLRNNTQHRTRVRHAKYRDLPPRTPADILERITAREAKLARRAKQARSAGLLP